MVEPAVETDDSTSIWRRVRRDVVLLGSGNLGVVVAQLGFRSILIVALVPAAYGRLALILSLYNTITIIVASGLPNSAARYISLRAPADDSGIIRSAIRAAVWPTIIAGAVTAIVAGVILKSPIAFLLSAIGLSSLVYSLLTTGIMRGRGHLVWAASILPIAALSEVGLLATMWTTGVHITPLSAFTVFCLGNVIGLIVGAFCTIRTAPPRARDTGASADATPTPREMLDFSLWLGAATVGVALMPLVMRFAATLDSYTVVAMIDVVLVILAIPQRVGIVIVSAVVPHATRALDRGDVTLTISRREHAAAILPFVLAATIVAFTPIMEWLFDALGRPEYAKGSGYLALALLAGPARILYGLVEGVLVAHGQGRFLAINSLSTALFASGIIFAATALGSTMAAFAVFVAACWGVYLRGLVRINRLSPTRGSSLPAARPNRAIESSVT